MYSIANTLRNNIEIALIDNSFKGDELAVIKALLLGQKKDISKDMYDDYASAGVIHILAVSGLQITSIKDVTPLPHNGCRPPKRRRV